MTSIRLTKINGMPAPATFKEAVPMLKKKPFTLEFATLEDAVETVLAPTKRWGVNVRPASLRRRPLALPDAAPRSQPTAAATQQKQPDSCMCQRGSV